MSRGPQSAAPESPPQTPPETPPRRRPFHLHALHVSARVAAILTVAAVCLAILASGLFALVRFGPLTDTGRAFIIARADGLALGSVGRLHVSGLRGDVWSNFTLERLSISDGDGAWLDARQIHVQWNPIYLLRRRFHSRRITVGQIVLAHRPQLQSGGQGGGLPVSISIEHFATRLETLPAFSVERGLFQIDLSLDLERSGGAAGALISRNLLHAGDGLEARFDLGVSRKVMLDAHAHESRGGALAGMLGLPVAKAVKLDALAQGDVDEGQSKLSGYSGDTLIGEATGLWTKAGGGMSGRIALSASSWTEGLMKGLGPQLTFSVNHTEVKGSVRDAAVRLNADNATLWLDGRIDTARQSSDQGVRVRLTAKDLSRLVPGPAVGAGQFDGVIKGSPASWDLQGRMSLGHVAGLGYDLSGAAGPIKLGLHRRELRLTATADGAGGRGAGLAAALAGGKPHVELDASRLADGRLLLRTLKAQGAGFKVDASGALGLLGDLSFKGDAALTNLGVARTGAKGVVTAHWSASQFRARQPWKLTADASGAGLVTGIPELDHFLGSKPQLRTEASFDKDVWTIGRADLTGAAARGSAKGMISSGGDMKLGIDWSAQGPFALGPLDMAGRAQGTTVVTGPLTLPHAEVAAHFDRIDLPRLALNDARLSVTLAREATDWSGQFNLLAANAGAPAHLRTGFRLSGDELLLSDLDAAASGATAHGQLGLRRFQPDSGDLSLSAGPGVLLEGGHGEARLQIQDSGLGPIAALTLTGANLAFKGQSAVVQNVKLSAHGPFSGLAYSLDAQVQSDQTPLTLNGSGLAAQTAHGLSFSFNGAGRFRRADFHTLSPATITLAGADRQADLDLSLGGGRAQVQARQAGEMLTAKAALSGVDLATLGENLAGRFDADLNLSGQGERLAGDVSARLKGARSRDAPSKLALNGEVKARLAGPEVTVDAAVDGSTTTDHVTLHAVLPAEASAAPFRIAIDRTKPISGAYEVTGELQPIWDLFFGGDRELGGQVAARGGLAGSVNQPRLTGHGALTQGRFEDAATGLKLRDLAAEVDLQDEALTVERFTAKDAKTGVLNGQGRVDLAANGVSTLTLKARGFQLLDNETAKATASGDVTVVRGADGKAKLSGDLTIDRADIVAASSRSPPGVVTLDVIERNKPGGLSQGLQAPALAGPSLALDVRITAPRRVFVRGLGLDAELSVDAHVVGDTGSPQLTGQARIVRGIYDFAGKRFELDDRGVIALASTPEKIYLDLTATLNDTNLTAIIAIKGTAAKPTITLSSTPTLPNDEVLSQVLFGSSAAQLTPFQAAQLAAAVTTLATGGGFDVMGGLSKFARLDRIAIGGTQTTGPTVSGGKYIGNRVYLEVTGGGKAGPSAQVEVRATKALSLISQVGGDAGAKLSIRWRMDYGKPKSPK